MKQRVKNPAPESRVGKPLFITTPSRAGTYRNPPLAGRFCLPGSARRRKEGALRRFDETSETLKLKNLEMLEFGNYGQKTGSYHGDFVIPARSHPHSLRGRTGITICASWLPLSRSQFPSSSFPRFVILKRIQIRQEKNRRQNEHETERKNVGAHL